MNMNSFTVGTKETQIEESRKNYFFCKQTAENVNKLFIQYSWKLNSIYLITSKFRIGMYMDEEQQIKFKALFKIISMQIF